MYPLITKPKPGVVINSLHPISKGLVGCWLFNEGAGGKLCDVSGNDNHGKLINMFLDTQVSVWGGSKFGGCLKLDGVDDYVDCGNNKSLNITKEVTVSVWIKCGSIGLTYILEKNNAWRLETYLNRVYWYVHGPNAARHGGVVINDDKWHHVVGTYSGSLIRLYIDGVVDGVGVPATGNINLTPYNVMFGTDEGTKDWFRGSMDDVKIYNRALPVNEISQLYHNKYCNLLVPSRCKYNITSSYWTGIINGVSNSAKINDIAVANIAKVNGVV